MLQCWSRDYFAVTNYEVFIVHRKSGRGFFLRDYEGMDDEYGIYYNILLGGKPRTVVFLTHPSYLNHWADEVFLEKLVAVHEQMFIDLDIDIDIDITKLETRLRALTVEDMPEVRQFPKLKTIRVKYTDPVLLQAKRELQNARRREARKDLIARYAAGEEAAIAEMEKVREKNKVHSQQQKAKPDYVQNAKFQRMKGRAASGDDIEAAEYVADWRTKNNKRARKHGAKKRKELEELKERVTVGDSEAETELAATQAKKKAKVIKDTILSNEKIAELQKRATAGDVEAVQQDAARIQKRNAVARKGNAKRKAVFQELEQRVANGGGPDAEKEFQAAKAKKATARKTHDAAKRRRDADAKQLRVDLAERVANGDTTAEEQLQVLEAEDEKRKESTRKSNKKFKAKAQQLRADLAERAANGDTAAREQLQVLQAADEAAKADKAAKRKIRDKKAKEAAEKEDAKASDCDEDEDEDDEQL